MRTSCGRGTARRLFAAHASCVIIGMTGIQTVLIGGLERARVAQEMSLHGFRMILGFEVVE